MPDSFPAIRKELEEEQRAAGGLDAEVDYIFDIPLRVAQSIVGFKHDEDCELVDGHFLVLTRHATGSSGTVSSGSTRAGFLRKLFGR